MLHGTTNDGQRQRIRPKLLGPPRPANTFPIVLALCTLFQYGTAPPNYSQAFALSLLEVDSQNNAN